MKKLAVFFVVLFAATLAAGSAAAQTRVVEAALCLGVVERMPTEPVVSSDPSMLPVVDTSATGQIFLWTKLSSPEETVVVHTWYRENPEVAESGPELAPAAEVELRVFPSESFRTWSTISLLPKISEGMWRVTVTSAADPVTILYQQAFLVK